jgi:hypothetical protein
MIFCRHHGETHAWAVTTATWWQCTLRGAITKAKPSSFQLCEALARVIRAFSYSHHFDENVSSLDWMERTQNSQCPGCRTQALRISGCGHWVARPGPDSRQSPRRPALGIFETAGVSSGWDVTLQAWAVPMTRPSNPRV